jgi:hypothetical protein
VSDQKYGGPYNSKPQCKVCGQYWTRLHGGSYDWQYKDCPKCDGAAFSKFIAGKIGELKIDENLETTIEGMRKAHIDKFASEQESLVAKFIKEKNCLPSEIVVVSHWVGSSIVVSVELKKDFEERQHGGDRGFRRGF